MSKIFGNIETKFEEGLHAIQTNVGVERADFCVGHFNLRKATGGKVCVEDMAIRPKSIVPIIGEPDINESYIRQQDVVLFMPPFEFKPIEANSEISGGRNDIAR